MARKQPIKEFMKEVGLTYEGTSREVWVMYRSPEGERHFVCRCKHLKPKTRANQIILSIRDKYDGDVMGFIAAAKKTSPLEAAGLVRMP